MFRIAGFLAFTLIASAFVPGGVALAQPGHAGPAADQSKEKDKGEEDRARQAVKEFDDASRKATGASEVVAEVEKLAAVKHILVVQKLCDLVTDNHVDAVNVAAAKALEHQGDARAVPALATALSIHQEKGDEGVLAALLHALGALKDRRAGSAVAGFVKYEKSMAVQKAAIDAAGKVRAVEAVDPLLSVLDEASAPPMRRGTRRLGYKKIPNPKAGLKEPCLAALREITGQSHGTYKEWHDWWSANRGTFVAK